MAILVDKDSRIAIQGITGREASMVTKHALAYGTKILAGVTPGKEGQNVEGVPVYDTLKSACKNHAVNTAVVYVPPAFACDAVLEAIGNGIKLVLIITERIPRRDAAKFLCAAKQANATIIGPNSVGVLNPGDRIKLGAIGGDNVERCFVPGSVGVISRSGGMTAECSWMAKQAGYGVSTSVSSGGDPLIGSPPKDILSLFENDPKTKAVILWGEPGTRYEEDVADFIMQGGYTKPLIAYIAGRFVENMPEGTVFGHAASIIEGAGGRPSIKMQRLKAAGAHVAENFNDIGDMLKSVLAEAV
ncbi:MAG: CoA-binding protein [Desulfobacterales bacterium]|jgi:succinyl-CoA synthetase alpha subunit|nr:succinate--CoA ligase subunit alpha [Desulfobacter sp.]MDP6394868.1 CoA-binding protein [Desulfobacterales bacterium]MDP6682039.1 CoA-binding protein [Desulfobacterales bacterium]MDP6807707.1 CoA-binding protein [Desulfobacterales bacterium]|tara:strand:+ start:20740 stop:21645 length:906 start_codon:yes stop_codon:yes gene_type:complete